MRLDEGEADDVEVAAAAPADGADADDMPGGAAKTVSLRPSGLVFPLNESCQMCMVPYAVCFATRKTHQ